MPHVVSENNFYISEIQRRIHRSPTRTRTQLEKEEYFPSAFLPLDLRQTPSKSIGYFDNCTSEFRLRTKSASNKNSKFSFRLILTTVEIWNSGCRHSIYRRNSIKKSTCNDAGDVCPCFDAGCRLVFLLHSDMGFRSSPANEFG